MDVDDSPEDGPADATGEVGRKGFAAASKKPKGLCNPREITNFAK